jgi:hypothetical protein
MVTLISPECISVISLENILCSLVLHLVNGMGCLGFKLNGIPNRQLSKVLRRGKGILYLICAFYHQEACKVRFQ